MRPHLLGIDDGPFDKHVDRSVPLVGVMMEGADLVEGIALTHFPIDGEGVTEHLAGWIEGLPWRPSLQGILFGGITIAGLGLIDAPTLAHRLDLPVLVVTRRDTRASRLPAALEAAGLSERQALLARTPEAQPVADGLYVAWSGTDRTRAVRLVRSCLHKANLPEPLRLAHLIATAVVRGASYGRA